MKKIKGYYPLGPNDKLKNGDVFLIGSELIPVLHMAFGKPAGDWTNTGIWPYRPGEAPYIPHAVHGEPLPLP